MDSVIVASIITGACTIVAAFIGALVIRNGLSNKVQQKVKGNKNSVNAEVINENGKTK